MPSNRKTRGHHSISLKVTKSHKVLARFAPSLQPWATRATRPQTLWGAGAWGGLVMVTRLRALGGLQDTLPEQGEAGPAIALTLE
jgi:hypothetical protein